MTTTPDPDTDPDTDALILGRPPTGFKVYETRDGLFSSRTGPYFIKGRHPDTVLGVRILDHHCNVFGIAHGGLLMSFCDTVLWRAAAAATREMHATASLTTHFIRPVALDAWLEGRATVLKAGGRTVFLRADLTVDGEIAVSAEGLWQRIKSTHTKASSS